MALHFEQVSLAALPANLLAAAAIAPVMWLGMLSRGRRAARPGARAARSTRSTRRCWPSSSGWRTRSPRRRRRSCRCGWGRRSRWAARTPRSSLRSSASLRPGGASRRWSCAPGRSPRSRRSRSPASVARRRSTTGPRRRRAASSWSRSWTSGRATRRCCRRTASPCSSTPGRPADRSCAGCRRPASKRLDALVITHAQNDHEGAALEVLRRYPTRLVVNGGAGWPTRVQEGLAAATGARRIAAQAGQVLTLGDIRMRLLWPPPPAPGFRPEGDPNLRAVVAHVQVGAFDLLLPADAESDVTAALDLPRGRGAQGRAPRERRRGPAGAARANSPRVRRDRGRPRQHVRSPGAVDAGGAARRRPRLPHRPRRHGAPARARRCRTRRQLDSPPCLRSSPPTSSTATITAGSASAARSCGRWPRPRAARAASSCSRPTRAPPRRSPAR